MNLDTNIAMGVRPPPIDFNAMNQGNVLANMAQLRSAENQNALAQYQLSSAKRTDASQEALMEKAKVPGYKMTFADAIQGGPAGMAAYKAQEDASTQALTRTKVQGEIDTSAYALQKKKLDAAIQTITNLNTPEEAIASVNESLANKNIDQSRASQLIKDIQSKPFAQFKAEQLKNLTTAAEQIQNATSIANNAANNATSVANNAATVAATTRGQDLTDTRSRQQFGQTQGLAERKFKWEQANQGKQYVEGPDGIGYGFDPKTNQMTPVMNAPAAGSNAMAPAAGPSTNALAAPAPAQGPAPSAAPAARPPAAAGGSGPMGVNLPANAAAGVNAPGTPFQGKAQALNESQSNATAFGMRMKESDAILEKLAKQGVLRGANIESTPFIGQSLGKVLPSFMGGTSSVQQQVNQAKENFITAVLRKESGATIQDSEFAREDRKYFPQVNDSDAVIKQKANARKLAIKAIEIQAGPGAKNIQQLQPSSGITNATANDPLGLGI